MLNKYPLWKTLLVAIIVALGALYATPNLYGESPAVQVSGLRGVEANTATLDRIKAQLEENNLTFTSIALENGQVLTRFNNTEDQLKARDVLDDNLGKQFSVALNLTPNTPEWLAAIGGTPMKKGLDLSGGVSFLIEVNMKEAINKAKTGMVSDFRGDLRNEKIRYRSVKEGNDTVKVVFRKIEDLEAGQSLLKKRYRDLLLTIDDDTLTLTAKMTKEKIKEIREYALEQNITIIRNRVNELGVAEPLVQRQGKKHIVIELPGVQDTATAKEILSATATIEFRLVDTQGDLSNALNGRVPANSILLRDKDGKPSLLKKRVMLTGDHIIDAKSGFDEYSRPQVNISLDSAGGSKMSSGTKSNIGKPMATVFIEFKATDKKDAEGNLIMAFYVKPENGNSGGVAHGGMLMRIADYSLCSAAMESREKYVATISFRSEFMSGAKIGSLLEVHTKISKHTKSLVFGGGIIISEGKNIMNFTGVVKKIR